MTLLEALDTAISDLRVREEQNLKINQPQAAQMCRAAYLKLTEFSVNLIAAYKTESENEV